MSSGAPDRFRFGQFEIDLGRGELRRDGLRLRIQEQPLRILAALLERPGEVLTREDLRERLWPSDTFVDFERSLNAAVAKLRQTLGDSAENPRYVETLARQQLRGHGESRPGVRDIRLHSAVEKGRQRALLHGRSGRSSRRRK